MEYRVEDLGLFRRVTIFQWMHFQHERYTYFPPENCHLRSFKLEDGTVHNASPDGKLNPFTAYASWIEPKIPHNIALNLALLSHNVMRLLMFGVLLITPILMGVLTFSNHRTRRQNCCSCTVHHWNDRRRLEHHPWYLGHRTGFVADCSR